MKIISYIFRLILLPFLFVAYCGSAFIISPFLLMIVVMCSLEALSKIYTEEGQDNGKIVLMAIIIPIAIPFYFSYAWITKGQLVPDGL